jgi:3D (Asp-Asp-Asp) domain-containing protein
MLVLLVGLGNKKQVSVTYNVNRTKSIEAAHIVNKYNNLTENKLPIRVSSIEEILQYGSISPISFSGIMTGYGPDCVGCGGRVGCSPRQDVRNGNIYFEDVEYGTIRIVATDAAIPCGSIIKISNMNFASGDIIAIALDRGGAIKGLKMDLLFDSELSSNIVGFSRNIEYQVIRWGW